MNHKIQSISNMSVVLFCVISIHLISFPSRSVQDGKKIIFSLSYFLQVQIYILFQNSAQFKQDLFYLLLLSKRQEMLCRLLRRKMGHNLNKFYG